MRLTTLICGGLVPTVFHVGKKLDVNHIPLHPSSDPQCPTPTEAVWKHYFCIIIDNLFYLIGTIINVTRITDTKSVNNIHIQLKQCFELHRFWKPVRQLQKKIHVYQESSTCIQASVYNEIIIIVFISNCCTISRKTHKVRVVLQEKVVQ